VRIDRQGVSIEDAAAALRRELGDGYTVAVEGSGRGLKVSTGTLSYANVRMKDEPGGVDFSVHGGGIVIGRIVNELTLARKVAGALRKGLGDA
jgi:hypothetical protein